jgi:dolichol-phosphate mannosyltransferase
MAYKWQVPKYRSNIFKKKTSQYCVCVPVINEGDRIHNQLKAMREISEKLDVYIVDGGSTDGSLEESFLKEMNIAGLITKIGPGKLSAQLRCGYAYAMDKGYQGVITVDGNNKDGVEAIPEFAKLLDDGYDFVQGSRYLKGGKAINTPLSRVIGTKFIHIPVISILARHRYTDTTNGFRAYSRRLLVSEKLQVFRNIFDTYELLAYLSVKAPKVGFKVTETPVTRSYPPKGKIPTKISFIKGNSKIIHILIDLLLGKYDQKKS